MDSTGKNDFQPIYFYPGFWEHFVAPFLATIRQNIKKVNVSCLLSVESTSTRGRGLGLHGASPLVRRNRSTHAIGPEKASVECARARESLSGAPRLCFGSPSPAPASLCLWSPPHFSQLVLLSPRGGRHRETGSENPDWEGDTTRRTTTTTTTTTKSQWRTTRTSSVDERERERARGWPPSCFPAPADTR